MSAPVSRIVAMLAADARDAAILEAIRAIAARAPARVLGVHARAGGGLSGDVATRLRAALDAIPGVEAEVTVRDGAIDDVAEAVVAEAVAELLVVGRSAGEEGRAAWGEHGRGILRAAGCPVLVVPADAGPLRLDRAAVGMDLSAAALDALALARALCARPFAVAVTAAADEPGLASADVAVRLEAQLRDALAARGLPPPLLRVVAGASPADALLGLEDEVDLLAVGSRGLSPLATVFLGSTAERLAGRSRRPVLVVRRAETRGLLEALFRA